jgi:hypothetical protein
MLFRVFEKNLNGGLEIFAILTFLFVNHRRVLYAQLVP